MKYKDLEQTEQGYRPVDAELSFADRQEMVDARIIMDNAAGRDNLISILLAQRLQHPGPLAEDELILHGPAGREVRRVIAKTALGVWENDPIVKRLDQEVEQKARVLDSQADGVSGEYPPEMLAPIPLGETLEQYEEALRQDELVDSHR
ncbi:MAG: hypothetical protein WDN27_04385 [Candidatus Saccharibacteria bacterium]